MGKGKGKKGPLQLDEVLKVNNSYRNTANTMSQAVGDGYLYKNSQVFKSVRDAFLALGYRFESNPPFPYLSFSLIALTDILEQKIVPVLDNVFFLEKLESLRPHFFKIEDIVRTGPTSNYLFHESAHCVAHSILGGPPAANWTYNSASERLDLLKIMLGESFANSVEFIAASLMGTSPLERWFINRNMYFGNHAKSFSELKEQIGLATTAKLTLLLFLYSNFLCVKITPKDDKKIFEVLGLEKNIKNNKNFLKAYKEVKKGAFGLNPGFRVFTTELYLKRLGFTKGVTRLLSFEPLNLILKSPELQKKLDQLSKVIDGTFDVNQIREEITENAA